jgi:rhodanese-related sulfurtransferase
MKKYIVYFLFIAFVASLSFTGCKETTTEVDEYQVLTDYMKTSNLDLDKMIASFVVFPAAETDVASKYIMDIRSAADFANGRIANSVNVEFKNILTEAAKAAGKPILVVCYTGQTATYAATLLRLYGYPDAAALKWGMSGWNATYDRWTANCKDITTAANWNTDVVASATFGNPKLSTGAQTGMDILKKRVEAVVAAGFKSIAPADVLANPGNYFINNYFSAAHYAGFGHVKGAYRINPLLIADGSIKNLDPTKQIVTYCYTGQTSGAVSAWLNVLGYNAVSCLWGINGMSHSNPFWTSGSVTNRWGFDSKPKAYSTVK